MTDLDPSTPTSGIGITEEVKQARRLAFGGYAADYHRVRPGWPADAVAWLCSPGSSGVTGALLPVDGGMTAA